MKKTLIASLTLSVAPLVSLPAPAFAEPVQLAQIQADVVIGRNGERIFLDPRTGQVMAVQPGPGVQRDLRPFDENEAFRRREAIREQRDAELRAAEEGRRARAEAERSRALRQRDDLQEQERIRAAIEAERERERIRARRLPEPDHEPQNSQTASTEPEPDLIEPNLSPNDQPIETPTTSSARSRLVTAKAQILLDRAGASPGAIDGLRGDNMLNAMDAFRKKTGKLVDFTNEEQIDEELAARGGDPFIDHVITSAEAAGPFVASIPDDYGEKAQMSSLGFTSADELLAEKFHMDIDYLRMLNPNADFSQPGTTIRVVNAGENVREAVTRIIADKSKEQVLAYDASNRLVAAYPATIGSTDTPSPSGTVEVERVAFDPNYTYDPEKNFKQGENDTILTIPPGPNGPVGSIWIALSKPTYGIHGTPEPSLIGKTNSHGCVRLTNWDATELAKIVEPGTVVEFAD